MQAPLETRSSSDAAQTDTARAVAEKPVIADNRREAVAQRKLSETMNNSPRVLQQRASSDAVQNRRPVVAQREEKTNDTGLPNQLKSGIESLSGMSMDHVKVHYNSDKPAQLQAHAYAQGSEIYLGAGQERHLPHEAWHVVQQAQGRVRPTFQMKSRAVNDDPSLEGEADVMGKKAAQFNGEYNAPSLVAEKRAAAVTVQRITGFVALPQANANLVQRVTCQLLSDEQKENLFAHARERQQREFGPTWKECENKLNELVERFKGKDKPKELLNAQAEFNTWLAGEVKNKALASSASASAASPARIEDGTALGLAPTSAAASASASNAASASASDYVPESAAMEGHEEQFSSSVKNSRAKPEKFSIAGFRNRPRDPGESEQKHDPDLNYGAVIRKNIHRPMAAAASAPSGSSARRKAAVDRVRAWNPATGHSGHTALDLTADDIKKIVKFFNRLGKYTVFVGPGTETYAGTMQVKIAHNYEKDGAKQSTYHITVDPNAVP
jgi:hypothetical protein